MASKDAAHHVYLDHVQKSYAHRYNDIHIFAFGQCMHRCSNACEITTVLMYMENGRRRSSHAHQPLASAPIRQGADACAAADADSAVLCHHFDHRNVSSHEKRKKSI
jgi:hypothetical protein